MDRDSGLSRVDVVLGDCFGASCSPVFTGAVEAAFSERGFRVVRNTPYAGGFTTRHYGHPRQGSHALQIELNRALYMDEAEHLRGPTFGPMQEHMEGVVMALIEAAKHFGPSCR